MAYRANATPTSPPEISLAKSELGFQRLLEMSAYSLVRDGATHPAVLDFWPAPGLRLKRSVSGTHAVALREIRIAQILAFVQKAKRVLSSNGVLNTFINRKCG